MTSAAALARADIAERRRLRVRGVVQGVGFRPFVWTLARRHGLDGLVRNTSGAVLIEVQGATADLDAFAHALRAEAPVLARIDSVDSETTVPLPGLGFRIEESVRVAGEYQPIAPDAATCADCVAELFRASDRRHLYPFINCTNCGPRFTIIEDVPYDRAATTMRSFAMCDSCSAEYADPSDRRFHAQPNACAACGPRLWFASGDGAEVAGDPVTLATAALRGGAVVALKGLGGFQLACLAGDAAVVSQLRRRKHRPAKPFAVMVRDLAAARRLGEVSDREAELLASPARPIVLLRRRTGATVADSVAPGMRDLGVMLPSTPIHHLLLAGVDAPLVMTSGNLSEEPIACANDDAVTRLAGIADAFLLHDRAIAARYDDSVVCVAAGDAHTVRRARGYAPLPLEMGAATTDILALGAHLKNTFCVVRDGRAFVGPHVGDLDNPLTLGHQREALATYLRLFRAAPTVVACDLHPDYASTRLAEEWWERGARRVQVQHHHAHIASVMAEHRLEGPLIGVAFDGAGLGPDGTIWGGEFLVCDERSSRRVGHLAEVAQPGGDLCAREGWRMALAQLVATGAASEEVPSWAGDAVDARSWRLVGRLAASGASPRTTSAGRLFDALASVLGAGHHSGYEAEAAVRLEALASRFAGTPGALALPVTVVDGMYVPDTPGLVATVVAERARGRAAADLAAAFHETLGACVAGVCARVAHDNNLDRVALSGGVFQNRLLLERTIVLLRERGFETFTNREVPANDGGVSLGQAYVAAALGDGEQEAVAC